ncbi:Exosome component 10 [Blyttiomyces sp. JEL0837]|nr:Exosome component 10 [Blyttiomyces sp. JEL0837]
MSVTIHTDLGDLKIEVFCEATPKAAEVNLHSSFDDSPTDLVAIACAEQNFLALCASGYYNGNLFHRNIKGFMVQTGDPTGTGKGGNSIWSRKFEDEIKATLKHNARGIVSMANKGPDTNLSQFFITYSKQAHLDSKYTVFGKVIDGLDTLDALEKVPVDASNRPLQDVKIRMADKLLPFQEASERLLAALAKASNASQFLGTSDLFFYKSSSNEFAQSVTKTSETVLGLFNDVLRRTSPTSKIEDLEDAVDKFETVVEVVDTLLEKADICLDEVEKKRNNTNQNPQGPVIVSVKSVDAKTGKATERQVIHAKNVQRPQLLFQDIPDNTNTPFQRKLRVKYNAKQPLDHYMPSSGQLSADMIEHIKTLGITDVHSSHYKLSHPYEYEIQTLEYPQHQMEILPEILYGSLDDSPFTWVDSEDKLNEMVDILCRQKEVAVDLENHDFRSFQGFCCLIQISTRTQDFVIDALALRAHLHLLNKCFTDPNIVKVFHGAEMDIVWLQRDFGVYVVNLFDTYHASHALEMESHGLAFLMKYYCDVETNKKYQLADWRIRPLTPEMLKYARMDTHFLPYIYDRMRNELLTRSDPETKQLLVVTLKRSEQTSLKQYEKDIYDAETGEGPNGWNTHLRKLTMSMTSENVAVFKALHAWRDHIAREEDESLRYVLPNHMLASLAVAMPKEQNEVLACCDPTPNLVRLNAADLVRLIESARIAFRENHDARSKEVERSRKEYQEAQSKWNERLQNGPLHTRFDEDNEPRSSPEKVINGQSSRNELFRFSVGGKATLSVKVSVKPAGRLGDIFSGNGTFSAAELANKRIADNVRSSLFLLSPNVELSKKRKRAEPAVSNNESTAKPAKKSALDTVVNVRKVPLNKSSTSTDETIAVEPPTLPELPGPSFDYSKEQERIASNKQSKETSFAPYSKIDESKVKQGKGGKADFRTGQGRSMNFK